MKISLQDVEQVAQLSRLELGDADREDFSVRLNAILNHMDMLNSVDTTNIEPTIYVIPQEGRLRADVPRESLSREDALKNAPEHEDGYFRVPKILEG